MKLLSLGVWQGGLQQFACFVASCNNVPDVRNFMNAFKELTFFLLIRQKENIF